MRARSRTSLEDVLKFCAFIRTATAGRMLADYEAEEMLRLSVERSFEVIGEALLRLERDEPELLAAISEHRRDRGLPQPAGAWVRRDRQHDRLGDHRRLAAEAVQGSARTP
jgi:hypothetical protein